jgi:acyl-CoA reductase-like NAD-dependent aldehyde dehydrogenase
MAMTSLAVEELTTRNPATGEIIGTYIAADQTSVRRTVGRARQALPAWRALSPGERGAHLRRVAEVLEDRAEAIGAIITAEMGRPHAESIPEVKKAATFFNYYADIGPALLESTSIDLAGLAAPGKQSWIRRESRGVVAVLKPWNAPVQQMVWAVAPALMAGCVVVAKPSEYTPGSALALQDAIEAAGLPDGVMSMVVGGPATGAALVDADVDMVSFTGSIATGRRVAEAAGRKLRKCLLELSGKDSLIVDERVANIDLVAAGIVYGAFSNCGHWCSSVERILLPASRFDEILDAVVTQTRALRVGPGDRGAIDVGPIANDKQLAIVSGIVDDAIERGATAVTGGARLTGSDSKDGYLYEPTVLVDVPRDARLETENVFGPVVAIEPYELVEEAIARANATNYGLGLSIWTDDAAFAERVTAASETGMVWVNEPLQSLAPCPWSVTKDSGYGAELGSSGLLEFTYEKVVQSQLTGNDVPRRPWYFPYA